MNRTKSVTLLSSSNGEFGKVDIPAAVNGPEVIRHGETIFVRKTHDVYLEATCFVVPTEPHGG